MKKKILVCQFHQETNTFNPVVWDIDRFGTNREFEGQARLEKALNGTSMVHGGYAAITEAGGEVIPTVFLHSGSGGRVADEVLNYLCERMAYYVKNEEFDGIYCALHGATCTENEDDACGFFLENLRALVGNKPIAAAFDLHAKITDKVLKNADIVCGYQTYPHIDFYSTGYRAAKHLMGLLEGKKYRMATVNLPLLVPPAGYTTREEPFKGLMDKALGMIADGKLTDASIFPVQPWLDIPEIMSRVVAISEDADTAAACAMELATGLWNIKDTMWPDLKSMDEIIDIAEANTSGKPVLLVDAADSPNGGSMGDSPAVAMRLMERGSKLRAGMFVVDPASVDMAFATGVGNTAEFSVGAGYTKGMPGPMKAEGLVRSLHDGWLRREAKGSRGAIAYMGKTAVVSFGNIDVVLCCRGACSGDPQVLRHFGVEPTLYDLIVVKANTSFREPYSYISDLVYFGDTPGAGASNLKAMEWEKLPAGLYPFYEVHHPEKAELW